MEPGLAGFQAARAGVPRDEVAEALSPVDLPEKGCPALIHRDPMRSGLIQEKIHVIDTNLVIIGWTGNIIAQFKSGDIMKMNNYSITSVFKKIDNKWKVFHSHESALPPEIIKK